MKKKIEILDKSEIKECWSCEGTGITKKGSCEACEGTGKFREPNYCIIVETPNGERIAFQSDFCK